MTGTPQDRTAILDRIAMAIDAASSVPIAVQLRGALNYGIATGEVAAGAQLPSVRRIAARLGISPVTVSGVFAQLQDSGQIEGRVGSGTFVTDAAASVPNRAGEQQELQRRLEDVADLSHRIGLTVDELLWRVTAAATTQRPAVRVLMLGSFAAATAAYADALRPYLRGGDEVVATILDDVDDAIGNVDLVAVPRTILAEASALFPNTPVIGLSMIPDEATRIALATLPGGATVAAVSYYDDFLSVMLNGISRLAPHIPVIRSAPIDDPQIDALLADADVLVHSTGAEFLRARLNSRQRAIEYRHTPDAHAVRCDLLPAVASVRAFLNEKENSVEGKPKQLVRNRRLPSEG